MKQTTSRRFVMLSTLLFSMLQLTNPVLSAPVPEAIMIKADTKKMDGKSFAQEFQTTVTSSKKVGSLERVFNYTQKIKLTFEQTKTTLDENGNVKSFERYYDKADQTIKQKNKTQTPPCSFELSFLKYENKNGQFKVSDDSGLLSREDQAALSKELHPETFLPGKEVKKGDQWDINPTIILASFDVDPKKMDVDKSVTTGTLSSLTNQTATIKISLTFSAKPNRKSKLNYTLSLNGIIKFNTKTKIIESFTYDGEYLMESIGKDGPKIKHNIEYEGSRVLK